MLRWYDKHNVKYIIGLAKNVRLQRAVQNFMDETEQQFQEANETVRLFTGIQYAAKSWDKKKTCCR